MKKTLVIILAALVLLCGCAQQTEHAHIAATTLPVYEFTAALCEGTDLTVTRLVTEEVSCLHDYSLNVRQVKAAEAAQLIVLSGAGLEEFLEDLLSDKCCVDASAGIPLLAGESAHHHDHEEPEEDHDAHHHEADPHIWLSPENAMIMADNICQGLSVQYPHYRDIFRENLQILLADLEDLHNYGQSQLSALSCRDLITFHDGFSYLAEAYDLHIVRAVEEESGSEASARELIELIEEVRHHILPAIFTERSGADSAASIISRETGVPSFMLDMAMSGNSYFDAMYHNIDSLKEALQ